MANIPKAKILVVDDEESILETVSGILEDEGYEVATAASGKEGIRQFKETSPDVVLLDVWLPDTDGLEVLKTIKADADAVSVIMISGHRNIEKAVEAIKLGAYDFLEKPLSLEKVIIPINNALEKQRLERENIELRNTISKKWEIIGEGPAMKTIKHEIATAGASQSRVIIYGESGTGKELVARSLHEASDRKDRDFIEVNCAAIPQELIESELFGHEKGSFTGASDRKKGKFELANRGTLFLDEIGDMSMTTQAKVLRIIETQEFQSVGGSKNIKVDVRIIAATNKDLLKEIKNGNFREDLYFRLNVIPIHMPPLRERKEDIPLLVEHFLASLARQYGQKKKIMSKPTLNSLMGYDWPGNVRELKNTIERFVIMNPTEIIDVVDIPSAKSSGIVLSGDRTLKDAREEFEKEFILKKLQENNWNISKTSEILEIERSNLHRKMKALGIETP
ncbi:MAG: sigma-54-dependent Fis family transcriptional regulator [Nitrospirae bacterium]|nr:sigma-54-dependent Fis family transcriptional regulator [Nitrospirota bacterium]